MSVFSKEGFKTLRWVYGVTLAGIGVAAFLVAGSYVYWQSERKSDLGTTQTLKELRARLADAKRERDNLRDSAQTYNALIARGVFAPEDRLELIEALTELKQRHQLIGLDYEVAPQRALKLSGGLSLPAVDAMGSRIKLRIRAYHDGELTAFLDDFPRMQRGFFPIDRCVIRRAGDFDRQEKTTPALKASDIIALAGGKRAEAPPPVKAAGDTQISALVEAECTLEWVTLVAKNNASVAKVAVQ